MTTDDEKRKAIRAALNRRQVEMGVEHQRPVSLAEMAEHVGIAYPTLVQIANGLRLPAWENMVKLGRMFPEILDIMEVPQFIPNIPGAGDIMQNYEKLTPDKRVGMCT